MKVNEINILDGALPIVSKNLGNRVYLFNPQESTESPCQNEARFMIPYYKVKRAAVESWLEKMRRNPPVLGHFEAYILTFNDSLGGEARYGGAYLQRGELAIN